MLVMSVAEAVLLQGWKITPFERPWSTMTRMESKPWEMGRLVMRSIEICWKGWVQLEEIGASGGCQGGVCVGLVGLACGTAGNEFSNKGGHAGPPVVLLEERDSVEISTVGTSEGLVDVFHELMVGGFQ